MKTYRVVAAVIVREGRVLATQRGYGEHKGGWEFPGGKVEAGETPEQALEREIREELDMTVCVGRHIADVSYDYPRFHLDMGCYLCSIGEGSPHLLEHEAARWLDATQLDSVAWLPADVLVVDALREQEIL